MPAKKTKPMEGRKGTRVPKKATKKKR